MVCSFQFSIIILFCSFSHWFSILTRHIFLIMRSYFLLLFCQLLFVCPWYFFLCNSVSLCLSVLLFPSFHLTKVCLSFYLSVFLIFNSVSVQISLFFCRMYFSQRRSFDWFRVFVFVFVLTINISSFKMNETSLVHPSHTKI